MSLRGRIGAMRGSFTSPRRTTDSRLRATQPAMPCSIGTCSPRYFPTPSADNGNVKLPAVFVGSMMDTSSALHCCRAASAILFRIEFRSEEKAMAFPSS